MENASVMAPPAEATQRKRSLWLKSIPLLGYAILLLSSSKILDLADWYASGRAADSSSILDPSTLSVRELKTLIEVRGLHGTSAIEKEDLVQLLKSTGNVTAGELREIYQGHDEPVFTFTNGTDFSREVEETKDSVWIVLVVPEQSHKFSSWDKVSLWQEIQGKVPRFGIRLGVLDCSILSEVCQRKKWDRPLILISLPKETTGQNEIVINGYNKANVVLKRVEGALKNHVQDIKTVKELESKWLDPSKQADSGALVFFTDGEVVPLFLETLSIKFAGKFQFGSFSSRKGTERETLSRNWSSSRVLLARGGRNEKNQAGSFYRQIEFLSRRPEFLSRQADVISRQAEFLSRQAEFLSRRAEFLFRQAEFLSRQANVISRHAEFLPGHAEFLSRQAEFLSRHAEFLPRHAEFLSRQAEFLSRQAEFLSRQAEFLSRHAEFLSRQADVISRRPEFLSRQTDFLSRLDKCGAKCSSPPSGSLDSIQ
ncbi:unnamed protein product [Darwinula stevensoni]|uniref:SAP domain-containing protein n=1 Tax=Darwinula stevensoni TaxID=69355 RepID=A0A7R8XJR6_9CRUS|nr:unnamed protein product [Darwinula stevensoni]CAG0895062.1 unnamed protein product [Darwinula stevensoni]